MMRNDPPRYPGFRVDRARAERLSDQLYAGFDAAIASGFYTAGDILPAREQIAARYGVSETVVRKALSRLMAEDVLVSHPGSRWTALRAWGRFRASTSPPTARSTS